MSEVRLFTPHEGVYGYLQKLFIYKSFTMRRRICTGVISMGKAIRCRTLIMPQQEDRCRCVSYVIHVYINGKSFFCETCREICT